MNLKQNQIITYRNGETGRVICIDRDGRWSIITLRKTGELRIHRETGQADDGEDKSDFDIMPEKKQLAGWVNVYPDFTGESLHTTRESADKATSSRGGRIACVDLSKYNITYEQGEGL